MQRPIDFLDRVVFLGRAPSPPRLTHVAVSPKSRRRSTLLQEIRGWSAWGNQINTSSQGKHWPCIDPYLTGAPDAPNHRKHRGWTFNVYVYIYIHQTIVPWSHQSGCEVKLLQCYWKMEGIWIGKDLIIFWIFQTALEYPLSSTLCVQMWSCFWGKWTIRF